MNFIELNKLYSSLNNINDITIYKSFGFSLEGWREDGFFITCKEENKESIKLELLKLANQFGKFKHFIFNIIYINIYLIHNSYYFIRTRCNISILP
jgi:hypothetical protein